MKKHIPEIVKISSIFVSSGLIICIILSLLLFGEGLQFIMPFLIFPVFFVVFLITELIPFFRKHPVLKVAVLLLTVISFIIII